MWPFRQSTKAPAEKPPEYVFCESSTASSTSPWHIRKVSSIGLKLGGGIDTPSLCGRVRPIGDDLRGFGGWDLNVGISEHHLTHCCKACADAYKALSRGKE